MRREVAKSLYEGRKKALFAYTSLSLLGLSAAVEKISLPQKGLLRIGPLHVECLNRATTR